MRSHSVTYLGEPDVVHELAAEGQGVTFGRDADACEVVVWSALSDPSLSRTAGRIWLRDGELWLRNLSRHHDLVVLVPGQPPEPVLPPRRSPDDPGSARSLPPGPSVVLAPAGCELLVRSTPLVAADLPGGDDGPDATLRLPPVPLRLQAVAAALCRPLQEGGRLPATYAQIAEALGETSVKKIRLLVAELVSVYARAVPDLAETVRRRVDQQESLLSAWTSHSPRLVHGVWRFDAHQTPAADPDDDRRRALLLPDYYEVAFLLVRRGLVPPPE